MIHTTSYCFVFDWKMMGTIFCIKTKVKNPSAKITKAVNKDHQIIIYQ